MKALILSAGYGTRLLPFTKRLPKPLFPIAGRPVIDHCILNLSRAGCTTLYVNTHHLHEKIKAHLSTTRFDIPVKSVFEPEILGTAGAVKHLERELKDAPFLLVNSDIVTDIDFKKVYGYHLNHRSPVTMVMHNHPKFNCVRIDGNGHVTSFSPIDHERSENKDTLSAFTGIHVIDPSVIDDIPAHEFVDIIDVYRSMIRSGKTINAYTVKGHYWEDMGTPEAYTRASVHATAPLAFKKAFSQHPFNGFESRKLKGDGSDRKWYRLTSGKHTLVLADHGIKPKAGYGEADAFEAVGNLLYKNSIPVPKMYLADRFPGLCYMEDLGDQDLFSIIRQSKDINVTSRLYRQVIAKLVKLNLIGKKEPRTELSCIRISYDRRLILEKECRYFVNAFLNGYLELDVRYEQFENEFKLLAEKTIDHSINGLMHRDMQSRNIMVKNNTIYFIDFQSAMTGPVQYDLASLLIDPYVQLDRVLQEELLNEAADLYTAEVGLDKKRFLKGYAYCRVTRNLQILGAFGFLTRVKHKTGFEEHIPAAVASLFSHIRSIHTGQFPELFKLSKTIKALVPL